MLQTLRNNMRHIMVVVAVAFILTIVFSWGMGGFKTRRTKVQSGIIGVVNGQKIMYQQFSLLVDQEIQKTKENRKAESISDFEVQSIRDKVWNQTIQDILMSQEVKRMGIETTNDEIVLHLHNNPPEFIRSHEAFQTDGKFDIEKYHEALRDPSNYSAWTSVENYLRNTIPVQKLGAWLISTIRVSDGEINEAYHLKNDRVNVEYVHFNPYNYPMDSIQISNEKIRKYYDSHKEDFKTPEQRKIKYVTFDLSATSEDSAQIWNEAEDLIQQLKDGSDFAQLATDYSDDQATASKGGDLGFFAPEDMPFQDAVKNARTGEIIGPVNTSHGVHIIQVKDRKIENGKTKIRASHILLKYESSPETYDRAYDAASYFSDELKDSDDYTFDELARREGYEIKETPLFGKGVFIPEIGMSAYINHASFREEIGFVGQPVTVNNKIYVFTISEIDKERVKPFDESLHSQIERTLKRDTQKEEAKNDCQNFWNQVQSSDFGTAAQTDNLEIKTTGFFGYGSSIPQIGKNPVFSGSAFALAVGDVSHPVETNQGSFVFKVIDKIIADSTGYDIQKGSIKNEILNEKMNESYMAWLDQLQKNAKIEDFREAFF